MKIELNRVMVSALPPSWSQTLTPVGTGQGQMRNIGWWVLPWGLGQPVRGGPVREGSLEKDTCTGKASHTTHSGGIPG